MRSPSHPLAVLVLLVVVVGCTGDDAETDGTQPAEQDTALLVVESMYQTITAGDPEAWRQGYADDALIVGDDFSQRLFADADWIFDDFDGDGTTSQADLVQFQVTLSGPADVRDVVTCETVADNRVDCTVTTIDALREAVGAPEATWTETFTVEDGQIIEVQVQNDLETWTDARKAFRAYEHWVWETYPDRYDTLFRGPCCRGVMEKWFLLPEVIPDHEELLAEYGESAG
jgi:hypothetical protein